MRSPGVILQHGPYGPPGRLGEFLAEHGIEHEVRNVWEDGAGDLTRARFVVSLGSQFSAAGADPEWIPPEAAALRDAVAADVPVLGLCFGGQALALALGAAVMPTPEPEIGWIAVASSDDDTVPSGPWAQFHYETFAVPPGAVELARSPAGPAAFRHGPHLGVQFHPEVGPEQMAEWLELDAKLPPTIDRDAIVRDGERLAARTAEQAKRLFAAWFDAVSSRGARRGDATR